MVYAKTVGSAVEAGLSYAPAPAPSGALRGSGPLAAAMRETAARPMRYAPGAVPRIPYRGVPGGGRMPFGKLAPFLPKGSNLGGLSAKGARLFSRALSGTEAAFALEIAAMFVPWGWNVTDIHDMSGFTLLCKTPGPINNWTQAQNNPNLNCTIPFQVPGADYDILATSRWVGYGGGQTRMNITEQWTRPAGGKRLPWTGLPYPTTVDSRRYPSPLPYPTTNPYPQLDPLNIRMNVPMPVGKPLPYKVIPHRQPDPGRSPHESSSGSQPSTSPGRIPTERDDPRTLPAWEILTKPSPGGIGPPRERPSRHVLRKPIRREKEKKVIMGVASGSMLGHLLNLITESLDLLNVAWESLPFHVQRELYKPNPWEKFVHIVSNLDKIRPGSFVAGFLSNQLEDKAFGKLGKIAGQAARKAYAEGYGNLQFQRGPADEGGPRPEGLGRDPYIDWLDQHMWGWV